MQKLNKASRRCFMGWLVNLSVGFIKMVYFAMESDDFSVQQVGNMIISLFFWLNKLSFILHSYKLIQSLQQAL